MPRSPSSSLILTLALALSTASAEAEDAPAWTSQPTRTFDSGYIVYVGEGEDQTPEGAHFRAEAAAVEDLANECSFAPKGARIEDHFDQKTNKGTKSYAKVGITFEECEKAQKTVDPDQIRNDANPEMAAMLKRYHDLIDDSQTPESSQNELAAAGEGGSVYVSPRPWAIAQPTWQVVAIRNPWDYYVVRQQVVYAKTFVILSPPSVYVANSPQHIEFVRSVNSVNMQMHNYEQINPTVRTNPVPWSTVRTNPAAFRQIRAAAPVVPKPPARRQAVPVTRLRQNTAPNKRLRRPNGGPRVRARSPKRPPNTRRPK